MPLVTAITLKKTISALGACNVLSAHFVQMILVSGINKLTIGVFMIKASFSAKKISTLYPNM